MTNLVSGLSVEMATMMVATVIATYTFIGGLGATFYVSYFNTAFIFVIMIIFLTKVYNEPNNEDNPLGTVSCFNLRDWSLITGRCVGGGGGGGYKMGTSFCAPPHLKTGYNFSRHPF